MTLESKVIFSLVAVAVTFGVILGVRANESISRKAIRVCAINAVLFTTIMIAAVIVGNTASPDSSDTPRVVIFWLAVLFTAVSIAGLVGGLLLIVRKDKRKPGAWMLVYSLSIVPVFFVLGLISRAINLSGH